MIINKNNMIKSNCKKKQLIKTEYNKGLFHRQIQQYLVIFRGNILKIDEKKTSLKKQVV